MKGRQIKFEMIKNFNTNITKTDLLLNNCQKSLSMFQIIDIITTQSLLSINTFSIKSYLLFTQIINQYGITSCDVLNNTAADILFLMQDAQFAEKIMQKINYIPTDNYFVTIAGMFFKLSYERALQIHVLFHYYGACIAYNLHILYEIFNKTQEFKNMSERYLQDAIRLFPDIKQYIFIASSEDRDFYYYIDKIKILNPMEFADQHYNYSEQNTLQSGSLIIISNEFKNSFDYIGHIFNAYKENILTANFTKIKLYETKIKTAIKMLENIVKISAQHHLHYHNSCADILQNAAICDIICGQYELALSSLTKAREFEKSNPKNTNFDDLISQVLSCLNDNIAS